jgi:hypothetical protein
MFVIAYIGIASLGAIFGRLVFRYTGHETALTSEKVFASIAILAAGGIIAAVFAEFASAWTLSISSEIWLYPIGALIGYGIGKTDLSGKSN